MMTPAQYAKLPVYAQEEIKRLRADASYYKKKLETMSAGNSRVSLPHWDGMNGLPVLDHSYRFFLGNQKNEESLRCDWIDVHICKDPTDGRYLQVSAGHTLVITPCVSNVIELKVAKQNEGDE